MDQNQAQLAKDKLNLELRKVCTKEAMERLGRVRMVNPTLTQKVEIHIFQNMASGRIKHIDDKIMKEILRLMPK